jgi:MFS family permease
MNNNFLSRLKQEATVPRNRILILFTLEGMLITLVNNLIGLNNNLFATRLGASDYELSLVMTLPQLVGMLVLIPGGILTDRLVNKRSMVIAAISSLAVFYVMIGFVPALGTYSLGAFLLLLAISTGPMTIYNVSWQAYFSDVVTIEARNHILTSRTALTFLIGIIIPFGSGALLASAGTTGEKIMIHQAYFFIGAILLLIQIFVLKKIKSDQVHSPSGIAVKHLKSTIIELFHNKKFLGFVVVAMFFYMTWHLDWTLYFIGQVKYLKMNEAWLSYVSIGNAVIQFLTLGFWSRFNMKRGVRFGMIFGSLGLATFPVSMIIATSVPLPQGKMIFVIFNTCSSFAMAIIALNVLQCLLEVLPEKNKTLNISIYTMMVTISNAVMPIVGVAVYTRLGADLVALQTVFWIIFGLRIIASGLWAMRWLMLRKEVL